MIIETGHFALVLALVLSLFQATVPLYGARSNNVALMAIAPVTALMSAVLVSSAFAALMYAYVTSDFSVQNVVQNSHSLQPLIYKITSVWGNHEGSMLLWVLILVVFGAMVALSNKSLPTHLRANALAVQGMITSAFLAFLLFTSNPFTRVITPPFEGKDLNPILQDLGLAIHPPLLYLGYVGFSMAFSFAMAALIEGRIDAVWARAVRPWVLLAWAFLTLGIAMGSYWAYYELGWGGWWFWDPVENASLIPWLTGTALIHSVVVMEKRDALKVWTILLAILTFSCALLGTFLVRSGVLTSVHAFAVDPERGVFILAILCLFIGGSLALFAWRAPTLKQGGLFAPLSREGALIVNNVLLTVSAATVLIGTLYPLALEAVTGEKISVGPPFFNAAVIPLMVPLFFVLPFGQQLAWKRANVLGTLERLMAALGIAIIGTLLLAAFLNGGPVFAILGLGLGLFVVVGSVVEITSRAFSSEGGISVAFKKAFGLPRSAWGSAMAHMGVGLFIIGVASSAWHTETIASLKLNQSAKVGAYDAVLISVTPRAVANYREDVAQFRLLKGGVEHFTMESAKRVYIAGNRPTTEAGIKTVGLLSQVYISVGEPQKDGGLSVRLYWKPYVLLVWLGCVVMALGGAWALTDRRFRLGVPKNKRKLIVPQAATIAIIMSVILISTMGTSSPAYAVQPDEILIDASLEKRARKISEELRLVCQNQSIDDSNAPLARDLRVLVRERLQAGDQDQAVLDYIVARYGNYVLLNPPLKPQTLLLWYTPILLLGAAILGLFLHRKSRVAVASPPLTKEEQHAIDQMVGRG
jgi:cytochrome c-type biogenesis protein CcmF